MINVNIRKPWTDLKNWLILLLHAWIKATCVYYPLLLKRSIATMMKWIYFHNKADDERKCELGGKQ
jgi:uncharacterized membrane protein YhdT